MSKKHNSFKLILVKVKMDNYSKLIERIAKASSLTVEDIDRKVEAKRAKLSGLISKEGAAQIIAAELGVNLEKEKLKIGELTQGMKRVHVVGKVIQIFPVRGYNKNGREGKVASLLLADDTSNIRVVFWDLNHIKLIEEGNIKEGQILEISNAAVRNGELHLSSFGDVKLSNEEVGEIVDGNVGKIVKLREIRVGQRLKTRAFIVQAFEPRYFEVCPECGKKVVDTQCLVHGSVEPEKRAVLTLLVDDGTESMRVAVFGEQITSLGIDNQDLFSPETFQEKKNFLLGQEKIFSGVARMNPFFNNVEISAELIEEVNVEHIIKEMESAAALPTGISK